MRFTTELEVSVQSAKDEEVYMKQLGEAVRRVFPEEIRSGENFYSINYLPRNRKNRIDIYWHIPDNTSNKEIKKVTDYLGAEIRKEKWFRKRNVFNIKTVFN